MRQLLYLFLPACFLLACNPQTAETEVKVKSKMVFQLSVAPDSIKGTYIGDFKGSPIAITINYIAGTHASGYNTHKGLTRNLSGKIALDNNLLRLQLAEPGNNVYDGEFGLEIDTTTWNGKGNWKPFRKGEEVRFSFRKQERPAEEFAYGQTYIDSLQNYIILKPDGSCQYTYLTDTTNTGQQLTIRGNYTKEKSAVTIYWQKNDVFAQKSVFTLVKEKPYKDDDYTVQSLKGEGRLFTEMLF